MSTVAPFAGIFKGGFSTSPATIPSVTGRIAKQLLEATGISVSVLRVTTPVRALGYINPKGFALGGRTVAGTLILTQFTVAVLMRFLNTLLLSNLSKDSQYFKFDQLPPFNLTLLFNDEYGYASYQRLLGVRFVSDGVVISNQGLSMSRKPKSPCACGPASR